MNKTLLHVGRVVVQNKAVSCVFARVFSPTFKNYIMYIKQDHKSAPAKMGMIQPKLPFSMQKNGCLFLKMSHLRLTQATISFLSFQWVFLHFWWQSRWPFGLGRSTSSTWKRGFPLDGRKQLWFHLYSKCKWIWMELVGESTPFSHPNWIHQGIEGFP